MSTIEMDQSQASPPFNDAPSSASAQVESAPLATMTPTTVVSGLGQHAPSRDTAQPTNVSRLPMWEGQLEGHFERHYAGNLDRHFEGHSEEQPSYSLLLNDNQPGANSDLRDANHDLLGGSEDTYAGDLLVPDPGLPTVPPPVPRPSTPGHHDQGLDDGKDNLHIGPPKLEEQHRAAIRTLLDQPHVDIPIGERERQPAALVPELFPHQRVGLTWLIKQEESHYKGGILADDMGLGKTLQALALIVARPPNDGTRKTTLIVVPTALLKQWEYDIKTKVKASHRLKVAVFHGQAKKALTVTRLMAYDIVITTYGTVRHAWKVANESGRTRDSVLLAEHAVFHRIILDEAHQIRNHESMVSKGVACLHGTYRLCITGTPLMNDTDDLYAYLRFLRIDPYRHHDFFMRVLHWDRDSKLHWLLSHILLRRTGEAVIDGEPILKLPELTVETVEVEFGDDQAAFYKSLEGYSQLQMNKFMDEGSVNRRYWVMFTLLLRLRQCCLHPHLIQDYEIPQGIEMTIDDMMDLARQLKKDVVRRICRKTTFKCPMCKQVTKKPLIIHPCGHHICGSCVTNLICLRPAGPFTRSIITRCPAKRSCQTLVTSTGVICYRWFAKVHLTGGDADVDSEEPAGFVVSDDDESTADDEHESSDDGDDSGSSSSGSGEDRDDLANHNGHQRDDDVVEQTEHGGDSASHDTEHESDTVSHDSNRDGDAASRRRESSSSPSESELGTRPEPSRSVAGHDSDDSSDDSIVSLNALVLRMRKKTVPNGEGTVGHDAAPVTEPDSELDSDEEIMSYLRRRKRPAGASLDRPTKRTRVASPEVPARRASGSQKRRAMCSEEVKAKRFARLRQNWVPSAKIEKLLELLAMIQRDFPLEKTLVFSQFTSFIDIMEVALADDGYQYRRYDGTMSMRDREAAVAAFSTQPEVKVLLMSLQTGNAGLNLYQASRVIIMDPFWNPALEEQAIKRAHRVGQTKPVVAYRILIKNTVEDRILLEQRDKRNRTTGIMDPKAHQEANKLTVKELAIMFGLDQPSAPAQ